MLTLDLFEGALDRDVTQQIMLAETQHDNPLYLYLTQAVGARETKEEKFEWYTSGLPGRRTQIDNVADDYDETDTQLDVDDSSVFYPNGLILCEATGEIMMCVSVDDADTITVRRGVGTAAAAASVADDAYLTNMGFARGEGADTPAARNQGATAVYNYAQKFGASVEVSGDQNASATLTEIEELRQKREKFAEVIRDIDHAFLFGAKSRVKTGADGKIVTTTDGALNVITTNVDNVGGTLSRDRFRTFAMTAFSKGSAVKPLIAGSTLYSAVHTHWQSAINVSPDMTAVGLRFDRLRTEWGEFILIPHRGMLGAYAGYGVVLEPNRLMLRNFRGDKGFLHYEDNKQANNSDSKMGEWWAQLGVEWGHEEEHAVIKGVTGAA